MSNILEIYKVNEKNCYPSKSGECLHVCTVVYKDKGIKDVLLSSNEIIKINNKNKHETSLHFQNLK